MPTNGAIRSAAPAVSRVNRIIMSQATPIPCYRVSEVASGYHAVSQKYLQTYWDEYRFRYNRRDHGNLIFKSILSQLSERAESRVSEGHRKPAASSQGSASESLSC